MAPPNEMARLKAECRLLGIPITPKDSADRLRHKLRKLRERYAQACRPFVSDDEDLDSLDISDLDSESESESPELDEPSLAARAGAVAPAGESPLAPAAPARPTASLVRKVLPRQQARKEVDVHIIPPRAPSPPPDGCFGAFLSRHWRRQEARAPFYPWVEVYWPEDRKWHPGRIETRMMGMDGFVSEVKVAYTDGETRWESLRDEPFCSGPPQGAGGAKPIRFAEPPSPPVAAKPSAARPRAPAAGRQREARRAESTPPPVLENPRAAPKPRAAPPPPRAIASAEAVYVKNPRSFVRILEAFQERVRNLDLENVPGAKTHRSKHRVGGEAVTFGLTYRTQLSRFSKADDGQVIMHYLGEILRSIDPNLQFGSCAASRGAKWKPHTDKNNDHSKRSIMVTCGTRKSGGGLWIREDGEEKLLDTYFRPYYFDGRNKHWTEDWAGGDRISLVFYTHKNCRNVADDEESPAPKRRRR